MNRKPQISSVTPKIKPFSLAFDYHLLQFQKNKVITDRNKGRISKYIQTFEENDKQCRACYMRHVTWTISIQSFKNTLLWRVNSILNGFEKNSDEGIVYESKSMIHRIWSIENDISQSWFERYSALLKPFSGFELYINVIANYGLTDPAD